MLRPVLSSFFLTALTAAALAMPATAYADITGTVKVVGSAVTFDPSGQSGTAEVAYDCVNSAGADGRVELQTALLYAGGKRDIAFPEKQLFITCDGTPRTMTVTYTRKYVADDAPAVRNGKAQAYFYVGSGGPGDLSLPRQDVVITGVTPPDTRASVKITVNAHPEPTRKGSKTTVDGKITRAGKAYAKKKVSLLFTPDGSDDAAVVATVKASRKGALKVKTEASVSGTYRFVSAETGKTRPGLSKGDHVEVVPTLQRFASCADLNEVYPHGVGRKGAKDTTSGTPVTAFVVDGAQYAKNSTSDQDRDGIACEKA